MGNVQRHITVINIKKSCILIYFCRANLICNRFHHGSDTNTQKDMVERQVELEKVRVSIAEIIKYVSVK